MFFENRASCGVCVKL